MVRQAKGLTRISFQPLLDPFGRETRKLPEASFIFGQFRKDLEGLMPSPTTLLAKLSTAFAA